MVNRAREPTVEQVVKKLADWWKPIAVVATVITSIIVGWNSKASADDLAGVKKLLIEQDKKTAVLDSKLTSIDRLAGEVTRLRERIDVIGDRWLTQTPSQPTPAAPPAVVRAAVGTTTTEPSGLSP